MIHQNTIPLPDPHDYCYEWEGPFGRRKFSPALHNGRECDRAVALYTAEQMNNHASKVDQIWQEAANRTAFVFDTAKDREVIDYLLAEAYSLFEGANK